jgi:hypothetical protein
LPLPRASRLRAGTGRRDASSDVEAWGVAPGVLKPWVETTEAIGFDKLTEVMERALAEVEAAAELARGELERAKAAL